MFLIVGNVFRRFVPEPLVEPDGAILVGDDGAIRRVGSYAKVAAEAPDETRVVRYPEDCCILPAFSDCHLHAPQLDCRGLHPANLMGWLENHIYHEEAGFSRPEQAQRLTDRLFDELRSWGIASAGIYSSNSLRATDVIFSRAAASGLKIACGMVIADALNPEASDDGVAGSIALFDKWHDRQQGRLKYLFTPRFAPACSMEVLRRIGKTAGELKAPIQTHLAESVDELQRVRKAFPDAQSYTELYDDAGILTPRTILAHCIHIDGDDIGLLRDRGCAVVHCPDSNLFLKSGTMPYRKITDAGIPVALGSDVGAGTTFSPFHHMQMMIYSQKDFWISPGEAFHRATSVGADILGFGDLTGTLQPGKDADLVVLEAPAYADPVNSPEKALSYFIHCATSDTVTEVYIRGKASKAPGGDARPRA